MATAGWTRIAGCVAMWRKNRAARCVTAEISTARAVIRVSREVIPSMTVGVPKPIQVPTQNPDCKGGDILTIWLRQFEMIERTEPCFSSTRTEASLLTWTAVTMRDSRRSLNPKFTNARPWCAAHVATHFGIRFHLAISVQIRRLAIAEQQPFRFQNDRGSGKPRF